MEELKIRAPAKLNLHLEVVKKRSDGFHDLCSLFTLIELFDDITFKKNSNSVELIESIPIKQNIVLKAANLLKDLFSVKEGVKIELVKSIPDQKGLGGGSSDAASTLLGLRKFWNLDISDQDLAEIALKLGSDVPFFLYGKTAWAEGRGEILAEYPYKKKYYLLFLPALKISTKNAFEQASFVSRPKISKKNFTSDQSFNSFEVWIRRTYSEMDEAFNNLRLIGKPKLSGTGSTIFVEFDDKSAAESAQKHFPELVLTKSLERSPLMQIIE
mgnify:FL=1